MTQTQRATIKRITLIEYWPTESKVVSRAGPPSTVNVIVRLEGTSQVGEVVGVGECQLRKATGDNPDDSWRFLGLAANELEGSAVDFGGEAAGLDDVRRLMSSLSKQAAESLSSDNEAVPFRGSLLGLETALLDLTAKSRGVRLADLLGASRDQITVAPPGHSLGTTSSDLVEWCEKWTPSVLRLTLTGDATKDLESLNDLAAKVSTAVPWWLEGKCAYSFDQATDLIKGLVKGMKRRLPSSIILEQPLGASRRDALAELQRYADVLTGSSRRRALDLRIMADESLAGLSDLAVLTKDGGCRAVNIKPGRVGGLIAAVDLARKAVDFQRDTVVALSGMANTSDVSALATHHLGLALPRLDHYTRAPGNDVVKLTTASSNFSIRTRVLRAPSGEGLGATLRLGCLIPFSGRYAQWPESRGPLLGDRKARAYPEERHTRLLGKPAMRSHLVEREALAHGLELTRYNPTAFVAQGIRGPTLIFGASARSPVSSAASFVVADKHKGAAHALLERAGVPVPAARLFKPDDLDGAIAYANEIGYPVVSKPVGGTGGAAVSTNIGDATELAAGFEAVRRSPRYSTEEIMVQRHIRGDVYRVIVNGDEVTAALMRVRPFVTGDGWRSVAELIIEKNVYRRDNPRLRKGLINLERSEDFLRRRGLSLEAAPLEDEHVALGDDAYLNGGGDSIDVLQELHPSIAEVCIEAVRAVPGLTFCGVDILLEDHRVSIEQQDAGVCELNSCPELVTPQFPLFGEPQPVARQLLVRAATEHGVPLHPDPGKFLTVGIEVEGRLAKNYCAWLWRLGCDLGVTGWVAPSGPGRAEAVAAGPTVAATVLTSMAILPSGSSKPVTVRTRPASMEDQGDFRLLEAVPSEGQ